MFVNFVKMHSLGNDFVIVDLIRQNLKLQQTHIKHIADRHVGIGCDQILFLEPPLHKHSDFYCRIFNANGQEVEQCGNGLRCAARLFYDSGYIKRLNIIADCLAGPLSFQIDKGNQVTLNMGKPIFTPDAIPFLTAQKGPRYTLSVDHSTLTLSVLSLGNPHAVIEVPDLASAHVKKLGSLLNKHPAFPKGVNVGFMQIMDPQHLHLRVFERGVGETLACGSGACAAVVAGIQLNRLNHNVAVSFREGQLDVEWKGKDQDVYLKGPANTVYFGQFIL